MSMKYIRDHYKVPAKRGGMVRFTHLGEYFGTIKSARDGHLRILLDDRKKTQSFHPTWNIEYL